MELLISLLFQLALFGFSNPGIAQIPIPDEAWKSAVANGFNAILVLILLLIQWLTRKEDRTDRERDRRAVNLLTRAVTEQTLAMAFLPRQFHDGAREIRSQLESEEGKT